MPEEDPPRYPKEASGREKINLEGFLEKTTINYKKGTGKELSGLREAQIEIIYKYLEKMDPSPLLRRTLVQLVRNEEPFRIKSTSEMDGILIRNEKCRITSRRFYNKSLRGDTPTKSVEICLKKCEIAGTIKRIIFNDEIVHLLSYEPIEKVLEVKEIHRVLNDFKLMENEIVSFLHKLKSVKEQLSSSL